MADPDLTSVPHQQNPSNHEGSSDEDLIDLRQIVARLGRGLSQTVGLALLGLVICAATYFYANRTAPIETSGRVTFAFKGLDRGAYPDGSKFQAEDLCAADLIANALKRLSVENAEAVQGEIRAGLFVDGIIPADIVKQRDKMRTAGLVPPAYYPDEFVLTLTMPRSSPLTTLQREQLLNEIVNEYRSKFRRTYADLPSDFGDAFETLRNADYQEYELILNEEIDSIIRYLTPQLEANPSFRSSATNLSFADLLKETRTFAQIRMFEILGQIQVNGISRDRTAAMIKMDYYLKTLEGRERRALAEEEVVQNLLGKTQEHAQNYVLGIKSQATQPKVDSPILDQGLIDSLLANDSYNFLVRRALEAGMQVKRIQSEKAELLSRQTSLQNFIKGQATDQSITVARIDKSLKELEGSYETLITHIRKTLEDYNRQQFTDAIRVSGNFRTEGTIRRLEMFGATGLFLGAAAGMALSLLGIYVGGKKETL